MSLAYERTVAFFIGDARVYTYDKCRNGVDSVGVYVIHMCGV